MAKKYDSDIVGWFYRNGKRIPVREKRDNQRKESFVKYKDVKSGVDKIASDKFDVGTYDVQTLAPVNLADGYQVTYCQIGDNYTEEEHNKLINEFVGRSDDGKVYLGKFEGTPEHSFHFESRREAVRIAKKYNQKSVWDWKQNQYALECERKYGSDDPRTIEAWLKCEIYTGGTGERSK